MLRVWLLWFVGLSALWAQSISYTLPAYIEVCGSAQTFTVTVSNNGSSVISDGQLTVQFPTGVRYVLGSVTAPATEYNVSNPDTPVFALPNIPPGSSITFSFDAVADCRLKDFIADPNNDVVNVYILTYGGGGSVSVTTNTYNVRTPSLVFSSIVNQVYTGYPGDVFVRTFTIQNAGDAPLSAFYFKDRCGNGLQILGADKGNVIAQTSNFLHLAFNASHFTAVGNGDGLLDPGESITFRDTIEILSCNDVQSFFEAGWGCYGDTCAKTLESGGVSFPNEVPNLEVTPSTTWDYCYGDPPPPGASPVKAQLKIKNSGNGTAYNVVVSLRQCFYYTHPYTDPPYFYSRFDTASVEISYNGGITYQRVYVDSVRNNNAYSCLSDPNPIRKMWLTIPQLLPGDSVIIRWDIYNCCYEACSPTWIFQAGWCYQVNYENYCQQNYFTEGTGIVRNLRKINQVSAFYPTDVQDGESFSVCYTFQDIHPRLRRTYSRSWWEFVVDIPPCYTYVDHVLVDGDGTTWDPPDAMWFVGNQLFIRYRYSNRPAGFNFWRAVDLCLTLQANCSNGGCSGSGLDTFYLNVGFYADTACSVDCRWCLSEDNSVVVNLHCPLNCPEGIYWKDYAMQRVSYGLPDNDNDGVPDGVGSLDFTRIRLDRAMYTDTIRSSFHGRIITDGTPPWWNYIVAIDSFTRRGNVFTFLTDTLWIYDAQSANTYVIPNITPAVTYNGSGASTQAKFVYTIDIAALISSGYLPPTFRLNNNDSVVFKAYYQIGINIGGAIDVVPIVPDFYVANNLLSSGVKCDQYYGYVAVIGYYFTAWPPRLLEFYNCDTAVLRYRYYLGIGPCCTNYCGNNIFPYEYRQWAFLDSVQIVLPIGYSYVWNSGRMREYRTQNNVCNISPWVAPINPVAISGNVLTFAIKDVYIPYGGSVLPSDDGFMGDFEIRLRPSCKVEPDQQDTVLLTYIFNGRLTGSVTRPNHLRTIYYAPRIEVTAPNATIIQTQDTVEWLIEVSNLTSYSDAYNNWLSFYNSSGNLNVVSVVDTVADTIVNPLGGGIYPIGMVYASQKRYFKIKVIASSCTADTLLVYAGWDCNGYPATPADGCIKAIDTLIVIPQESEVIPSIQLSKDTINICDTVDVIITLSNIQNGHAYNLYLFVSLPTGMSLISGTYQYEYYVGSGWQALPAPSTFFGYFYWWLAGVDTRLGEQGLIGAYDPSKNVVKVRFRVATDCNYISGSTIKAYAFFLHPCGALDYNLAYSDVVGVYGAVEPYDAYFRPFKDTVRRCFDTVTVYVHWLNLGPGTTSAFDTLIAEVPLPLTYVPNSTDSVYQFYEMEPVIQSIAGYQRLKWPLINGIAPGDSANFTFQVAIPPSASAGTQVINLYSVINRVMSCGSVSCNTFVSTGSGSAEIVIERTPGLWTGEQDRDWFNPYNWGDCQVPTCATDVVIPDVPNEPEINGATAQAHHLLIESNSSLSLTSAGVLHVCGNLTIQPNASIIAMPNSELHFVGSTDQYYTHQGSGAWQKVFIEQSAVGQRIILNTNLVAMQSLQLNTGVIDGYTNSRYTIVRNNAPVSVNAGSANSYVHGILRRYVGAPGLYYLPVGHLSKGYQLAELEFTTSAFTDSIDAYFTPWGGLPPFPPSVVDCGANYGTLPMLDNGYWTIAPVLTLGTPYYNLHLNPTGYTNASGAAYTIVKRETGPWYFPANCDPLHSVLPRIGRLNIAGFSDFAIAQASTPLPIPLQLHAIALNQEKVLLQWTLEEAQNVRYYIVQKQLQQQWSNTDTVQTQQWYDNDVKPGKQYYYRVQAVFQDGEVLYSNVASVSLTTHRFRVTPLPNPFEEVLTLQLEHFDPQAPVMIKLYDSQGKEVFTLNTLATAIVELPLRALAPATYYLVVLHKGERIEKVLVKK